MKATIVTKEKLLLMIARMMLLKLNTKLVKMKGAASRNVLAFNAAAEQNVLSCFYPVLSCFQCGSGTACFILTCFLEGQLIETGRIPESC